MARTTSTPGGPPPSQKAVADLLPPGTHIMKNGGRMTHIVQRVDHMHRDGAWETTVVVKLYGNRNLPNGGFEGYLRPVRVVKDGIDVITPERAAACEAECIAGAATYAAALRAPKTSAQSAAPVAIDKDSCAR